MAEEYVCTLNEASLKKAKEELNENPSDRMSSVQAFREWIEQQKHINCITSTEFLLPFLRTAKFSQLRAREILEGYLTLCSDLPNMYRSLDPMEELQLEAIKMGIMLPLPGYDKNGRKIILYREGAISKEHLKRLDKDRKFKDAFFKSFLIILKLLLFDENCQVNGFIFLDDYTGFTMAHLNIWGMQDMKDMMRWQGNYPGRFKCFYLYNSGSLLEVMMEMMKSLLKKKTRDRMQILGDNLENVYKVIPMEFLPVEYLPDDYKGPNAGTIQELAENVLNEVQKPEIRERIVRETLAEWTIDVKKKDTLHPVSSFRKLNID